MNEQLYKLLLCAHKVFNNIGKYQAKIEELEAEILMQEKSVKEAEKKARNAHRRRPRWIVPIVLASYFAILSSLMCILYFQRGITGRGMMLLPVAVLISGIAIFLFVRVIVIRKRAIKRTSTELEFVRSEAERIISELEIKIRKYEVAKKQYLLDNSKYFDFLPPRYRDPDAIAFMLQLVEDMRVDSLKEAINFYEYEMRAKK